VRGYADQMLRVKSNPTDPSNRRISILVKNDDEKVPEFSAAGVVNGSTPLPGDAKTPTPAENGSKPPNTQPAVKPASPATSPATSPSIAALPAKPASSKPTAKPSLMDKLKAMLPGKKK